MKKIYSVVSLSAGFISLNAFSGVLPLDQYLAEVKGSNDGYSGAMITRKADLSASAEAELTFSPQFFTNFTYTDDSRQTEVPAFEGNRTVTDASQFGFKKLFDFGLQTQLSYGITSTTVYGISPALVPQPSLYTSGLTLTLTQSLWQNGFGATDKFNEQVTEAQDRANAYQSSYQGKSVLSDAESDYWQLAVARETLKVERASLERTLSIKDFNEKRVKKHLIDQADLLTSIAQAKSKEFEVKTAVDNERVAARVFNSARGVDSDEVSEDLSLPEPEAMQSLNVPKRAELRDDVKAAQQNEIAVTASSEVAKQKQMPSLNLVGTVSSNGLDPSLSDSTHDTFTTQYPYYQVGFNFSVPLDFGTVSSVKKAYAQQIHGAEMTYHRKVFDQENMWKDLLRRFTEAKERLSIAFDVEKAQLSKLQREESRQKEGLTTTYQVFQYEIDYLTSELNRIQTQGIIFNVLAQMKTFQE